MEHSSCLDDNIFKWYNGSVKDQTEIQLRIYAKTWELMSTDSFHPLTEL